MRASTGKSIGALREQNPVEAVWRINRRWIVHGGLRDSATAYLNELEANDPARLRRSCRLAMDLVHGAAGGMDPKPWFYAGLFALAEADEAKRFLGPHPLTRMVWDILHGVDDGGGSPESLRVMSGQIADAIRSRV